MDGRPVATTVLNVAGTGPLTGVTRVDVGHLYSCARLGNGQARCWGHNLDGSLGDGTATSRELPVAVTNLSDSGPLLNLRQIRTGRSHTCAVLTSGQLRCWGDNDNGQVGDGTTETDRRRPRIVIT